MERCNTGAEKIGCDMNALAEWARKHVGALGKQMYASGIGALERASGKTGAEMAALSDQVARNQAVNKGRGFIAAIPTQASDSNGQIASLC